MPVYRNTCPRNCYGSCGIISHLNGGKITKVLGDPEHSYTQGRLCAKGYALLQYPFDEYRLKYPMRQVRRGSGEWRHISWDQAYQIISDKIFELNKRYASNLALGYFKGTGNMGLLHHAVEGMFAGLGAHTRPVGDSCSITGDIALRKTLGELDSPDPEEMANSSLIVLWGANPAITNVNQMRFIHQARKKDTPLVVIDPVFSQTAERSDLYIQIKPGTDAWLAWGVSKILFDSFRMDQEFLRLKTVGWEHFVQRLCQIDLDEVHNRTGVSLTAIEELAELYANLRPAANWIGLGILRNRYGGEAVKAISALVALTGNLTSSGGGLYFRHHHILDFPRALTQQVSTTTTTNTIIREIPINDYAQQALELRDPPLKMLWISCANPLAQDYNLRNWNALLKQMELVITVDLYLTRTAEQSDLLLPASSFFEEEDLHLSFWHHLLSINEKSLPAFYEAKSDLQIARELTQKLNSIYPGFSNFPADKEPSQWIEEEISPQVKDLYALENASELKFKPHKRKKEPISPTWRYHFPSPQFEVFKGAITTLNHLYKLLTPQSLLKFHSQYETLPWLNSEKDPVIELAEETALRHNICEGSLVEIYNENGRMRGYAKINPNLLKGIIVTEQSGQFSVNRLIKEKVVSGQSVPYYDCRVSLRKVQNNV
ncbi:anaerobic dehydrogenase, typically selenocysteine-containing [Desulfosporosinus orientis DSM 765]|uniref:Anaerobic dehydrogenase, typically selenocysteine-containing n=1 Tax=Desulfosporosinus orientis (strain ATCC 19365 / DSM 765 / NCIMB 8382 / VKM B-1628 / Singapore I) TaxID=768706 RepID=G7W6L0_DESOD|nr:molybdopterin-dependent oxidoreductase [Desulfosporosinus orientis]AET68648.1 anaerobic dehydrogenase, typically selenocysteine-containing [Desulfosporosinus orientis DSM 765]